MLKGIAKEHFSQCLFWLLLEVGAQKSRSHSHRKCQCFPKFKDLNIFFPWTIWKCSREKPYRTAEGTEENEFSTETSSTLKARQRYQLNHCWTHFTSWEAEKGQWIKNL